MIDVLLLLAGVALLYFGAEWLVGGSSGLALSLRIPQLVIGLTVVAYGTSMPEVVVGIRAGLAHQSDIVVGNVVGSNIANLGLILGISVLVRPARVAAALANRELPVLAATTALIPLALLNGRIERWEALGLVAGAVAYTGWMLRTSRRAETLAAATADLKVAEEAAEAAGAPKTGSRLRMAAMALAGLGLLVLGGHLFVGSASALARAWGISERIIALTLVAVGTSLPELATSVVAAVRGHSDIAVGNVVGSNIFNALLCLGSAGLVSEIVSPLQTIAVDLSVLGAITMMGMAFLREARVMPRWEGGALVAVYAAFLAYLAATG